MENAKSDSTNKLDRRTQAICKQQVLPLSGIRRTKEKKMLTAKDLDIRPRHRVLQSLEGWYQAEPVYPPKFANIKSKHEASGSRVKLTRWALRNGMMTEQEAVEFGAIKGVSFKLSCRHNDLLRLHETNHYKTCLGSWRGMQMLRYLSDPDVALIYVPDASGKYQWRALVRLVHPATMLDKYAFFVQRCYGNAPVQAILEKLNTVLPVYVGDYHEYSAYMGVGTHEDDGFPFYHLRQKKVNLNVNLIGCTKQNNPITWKHVWSDHRVAMYKDGFLEMSGFPVTKETHNADV